MSRRDPFSEFIRDELDLGALDDLEAERRRRRQEAIDELLRRLEELKSILNGYSPYGRIPPKDNRD